MAGPRLQQLCLLLTIAANQLLQVQGGCASLIIDDMRPDTLGTQDSSGDCSLACFNDPRCHVHATVSGSCYLYTNRGYELVASSGDTTSFLVECDYWDYAGWEMGCGSTYSAEMGAADAVVIDATSRQSCWYQCLQYPRCQAWDWDTTAAAGSQCSLVSDNGLLSLAVASGVEHHTIICPTEPYASFISGWEYYPAHHVNGGKLQGGTMSFIECQNLCDSDSSCTAVDWDVDVKKCWFHSIKPNGKDTSCDNMPRWSKNMYHMKKTACMTVNYPQAFFTVGA